MKFSSSVVTTSSTPSRVLASAGSSRSSAPAAMPAAIMSGNSTSRGRGDGAAADRDRSERAQVELPFGADVVEVRAERDRSGEAGEDQRRGARERFADREARAESAVEQEHSKRGPPVRRPRRSVPRTAAA